MGKCNVQEVLSLLARESPFEFTGDRFPPRVCVLSATKSTLLVIIARVYNNSVLLNVARNLTLYFKVVFI